MKGESLPEGQTRSDIKLINKVRTDLGVPVEPKTKEIRDKHEEAAYAGKLLPLEGKTPKEKENILQDLFDMGIPLPKGRTRSEKALIAKITGTTPSDVLSVALAPSEQMRRAKAEGLLTPLKGKTPEEREKILKGLAMLGMPLPEGQSPSENKLIEKVRTDLGLPIEPETKEIRNKHEKAAKAGKLLPLEGKTPAQKEKILKGLHKMDIPLPVGRTPSEKSLIAKIAASPLGSSKASSAALSPSELMRKAKAEGLMTSLKGKSPKQREKILKGLAMKGLPLPEPKSPSEKKIIKKVRTDLGVPIEPKTKAIRDKHEEASKAGKLLPLEGKSPAKKEKILKDLHNMGIPLPKGRTPSEKSLIAKIAASPRSPSMASSAAFSPSEQMRRAKAEGLMTSLKGKTPEQKEKIMKGLAMKGLPLPEAQSLSEKKLMDKVRKDLGLPKEPDTKSMKEKHEQAAKAGLLQPLEGKTPKQKEKTLKGLHDLRIPLPEGRTPSEKALIDKVKASSGSAITPSEQLRTAKAEGLLTPLKGKTPEQKEKILKGLAMKGLPLPEAQSLSEKKLMDKVRKNLGLPKEPDTKSMKEKHEQAAKAGLLQPLEGKTPEQKEKTLKGLRDLGIPLPEGRTPSEKALIDKVKASPGSVITPFEQLRKAKAEGLLTPLKGKTPEQKEKILKGLAMKGLPLPKAESPSDKILMDKVRADLGLPKEPTTKSMKEKYDQAAKAGLLQPLISPSEQLRKAKAEGLLTPLKGKTPEKKEKILKGLAMKGLPLPEAQSPSEKKLIDKVRADLGLPKDPTTKSMKEKHEQAAKAGLLQPLEGKTPAEKAQVLKGLRDLGIPLPDGRTPSEKALIGKIKESSRSIIALSEKLRRAEAEGLLTPLTGKSPEEKEKIVKGLAMKGLPLPEAESPSEKELIDKVRVDLGLPKTPTTKAMKKKYEKAAKAGLLQPLEGKTPAEKETILKGQRDFGIPLPEGRTPSEKALIAKIKASPRTSLGHSERLRKAKAEGLLTPLSEKTPEEREKILKGLAMMGLPLPEGQSPSANNLIRKIRTELGLPIEPKNKAIRDKHEKAAKAGKLLPLEGKTPAQKEKILKGLHNMGIPLPVGRTPSEKSLIAKIAASPRSPSKPSSLRLSPSEQLRRAKAKGLLTPLEGKTPEEKEKIIKELAMIGLPLPEGQSPSEKKLIGKVRTDLGVPIEPKTKAIRDKHEEAAKAGKLLPLEGKTAAQKEKILKGLHNMGIPLPVGRTPSEKSLIAKIAASPSKPSSLRLSPSEQLRRAKAKGLLTPLEGKTPEEKEKILKELAMIGLPLPEGQSPSEKKLIGKVRTDLGVPIEPKTKAIRDKHEEAAKAGKLLPLEGKTAAQKGKILKGLHDMGIPLPVGRTPSEKELIAKIMAGAVEKELARSPSAKQAAGIAAQYEEIQKTTKCDRACGCDKKKIRFKHSYVKIRVTSPDMSSFCDCPDECLPSVKSGVFIDSDGIQVTIGSAVGVPSLTTDYYNHIPIEKRTNKQAHKGLKNSKDSQYKLTSLKTKRHSNTEYYILNSSRSGVSNSTRPNSTESDNIYLQYSTAPYKGRSSKSDRTVERCLQLLRCTQNDITSKTKSTASSHGSILVIKSEISLCSTISNKTMDTVSLTSNMDSSISPNSTHYERFQSSDDLRSSSLDELISNDLSKCPATIEKSKKFWHIRVAIPRREYTVMRMSQTRLNFGNNDVRANKLNSEEDPVMLINDLPSKFDVSKIMNKIMSKKRFADASTIFVVIPMSEDEEEQDSSNCVDSITSIHSSESEIILKDSSQVDPRMLEMAVEDVETDATTIRLRCCKSKKYSDLVIIKNCSTNKHCTADVISTEKGTLSLQVLGKASGRSRLPDKPHTPHTESLDQSRAVHMQRRGGSSHFPHKTTDYYRLPDISSTILLSEVPSSSDFDWSSPFPSETYGCCYPTLLETPSTESSEYLRNKTMFSWSLSAYLGQNMHSPNHPSKHRQYKEISTPHLLRAETTISRRNRQKPLSHTIRTKFCAEDYLSENEKSTGIIPDEISIRDLRIIDSDCEEYCLCENIESSNIIRKELPNQPPLWLQSNQKCNKMPTDSTGEEYYLCEVKEITDIMLDDISTQKPQIQTIWKSQMSIDYTGELDYECEELKGTAIIPDEINIQKSWVQTQSKSKMPIASAREEYCVCKDIEATDTAIIPEEIFIRKPQIGVSRTSKMPIKLFHEEDYINKDIEDTATITVKISKNKGQLQASCKSKMPTGSAYENYCIFKDIKSAIIITDRKQTNQKDKAPIYSTSEENGLCLDKKADKDMIIVNLYSRMSKMSVYSTDEDDCLCEDIESANIIANKKLTRKPFVQSTRQSKMPIDATDEHHSLCNVIDGTITDKMLNQEPQPQSGGISKMLIDSDNKDHCLYDDVEGINESISWQLHFQANQKLKKIDDYIYAINDFVSKDVVRSDTASDETDIQQSRPHANQKSKKLTAFATKENFVISSVENLDVTKNESREYKIQQPTKNLVVKGNWGYREQSIDSTVEFNYVCQQQSKAFAIKVNCSNKSAFKENNQYQQQSKNFVNNGFCAYEEVLVPPPRSKLCIAGQVQHEAKLKHSKL
ncbi:hypothetical protein PYW07_000105 [Mythimna separata]|uniref:Uncharacterized protein n=1 Tax=Mythimna separata TaxID=271217 RepID=A0AAD7Z2P7_MYTSE|nr:hypothetical protein PYW07_000105 [Mythimna separata]